MATFDDLAAAGRAVSAVTTRLRPAALGLMDRAAVAAVEAVRPIDLGAVGTLLLGQTDASLDEVTAMADAFAATKPSS